MRNSRTRNNENLGCRIAISRRIVRTACPTPRHFGGEAEACPLDRTGFDKFNRDSPSPRTFEWPGEMLLRATCPPFPVRDYENFPLTWSREKPGDRLTEPGFRTLIPVVPATVANEDTFERFKRADQIDPLHTICSSPMRRTLGIWPSVSSL